MFASHQWSAWQSAIVRVPVYTKLERLMRSPWSDRMPVQWLCGNPHQKFKIIISMAINGHSPICCWIMKASGQNNIFYSKKCFMLFGTVLWYLKAIWNHFVQVLFAKCITNIRIYESKDKVEVMVQALWLSFYYAVKNESGFVLRSLAEYVSVTACTFSKLLQAIVLTRT